MKLLSEDGRFLTLRVVFRACGPMAVKAKIGRSRGGYSTKINART